MKPRAGQLLSGTIRLVRPIADGGMGCVWVAEHLVLGKHVAVKVMAPQWALVPTADMRFLREARMTAAIDSPHVVRVLDCRRTESDEPFLVLELLEGENLEQRVSRDGPLPLLDVAEILGQACEAVAATHRAGIVHRDLKPENVFLVRADRPLVKLLDFGVAKPKAPADCLDVDRLPAGTPQYMSPEHMFEPETTDERSDLFSLGAVAYFALTGSSPWDAGSLEGLYLAMDAGAFQRPSELRDDLPRAIDAWFERALARDPADRFPDASAMARALEEAVRDERDGRSTAPPPPRAPRRVGRLLALLGLTTLAVAVAIATTADASQAVVDAPDDGGVLP
jgi:serine/threonine-protein kinase